MSQEATTGRQSRRALVPFVGLTAVALVMVSAFAIPARAAGPGTLTLAAPASPTITENAGSTTVKVTRTDGSTGAVGATISLGGTAAAGERTVSPTTVNFANGDTAPKTITVTALNDAVTDGNKTVILFLTGATGGVALSPQTTTVTITDDDGPGTLSLAAPASPTITENGGSTTVTVRRTDGRVGAVGATISLGGTAAAGERSVSPTTVTFADGDTTAKVIRITALNDAVADGNKTVILALTGPTGGVNLSPGTATVTITDDDGPGTLWFAAPASPTITEHGGSTTVKVRRTGGSIGAVGATIRIGGSAAMGERVVTPKTVTFADGDTTPKVIRITAVDDSVVDGNKRVTLLLVNATGGVTLGTYRPTVTIVDNDG